MIQHNIAKWEINPIGLIAIVIGIDLIIFMILEYFQALINFSTNLIMGIFGIGWFIYIILYLYINKQRHLNFIKSFKLLSGFYFLFFGFILSIVNVLIINYNLILLIVYCVFGILLLIYGSHSIKHWHWLEVDSDFIKNYMNVDFISDLQNNFKTILYIENQNPSSALPIQRLQITIASTIFIITWHEKGQITIRSTSQSDIKTLNSLKHWILNKNIVFNTIKP